jgi:GNAT superfamily N-acetyltransferase
MTYTIEALTAAQMQAELPAFIDLLQDSVRNGASVGYVEVPDAAVARAFWEGILDGLVQGKRVLLVARQQGRIIGTVQLDLAQRPNSLHRAEVQKLLVHSEARQQGIGWALMQAIEAQALHSGRTLLVLDTVKGDVAEVLYLKLGYTLMGYVPAYVTVGNGVMQPCAFFYKHLT